MREREGNALSGQREKKEKEDEKQTVESTISRRVTVCFPPSEKRKRR